MTRGLDTPSPHLNSRTAPPQTAEDKKGRIVVMMSCSCSCIMSDLGPTWDEDTISVLLGNAPAAVEFLHVNDDSSKTKTRQAKLSFVSRDVMQRTVAAYQGLAVPMTHGYHYYSFSNVDGSDGDSDCIMADEGITPPLSLQLMSLPSKELERRLNQLSCKTSSTAINHTKSLKKGGNRTCKVYKHALMACHLAQAMKNSRPTISCLGVPVPAGSTHDLLNYLRFSTQTLWPPQDKQRSGVSAGNYLTVRKQHPPEYDELWNLCEQMIRGVIPDAVYNALAITRGFYGSPHVDNHDKTFQHVIALGEFEGGYLCAEADEDGKEVMAVDVKCRFGRIDGSAVHWVSGWKGERYSIVYYSTSDDDWTEIVPQSIHTNWMKDTCHVIEGVKTGKVPQKRYAPENPRLPSNTPILGLGCSSFSTFFSSSDEEVLTADTMSRDHAAVQGWVETIRHAILNRGINLVDTAPWYGHGISEITLGYALDTILLDDKDENDCDGKRSMPRNIQNRKRTGSLPRSSLIINTKVGRYEYDPLHQFDFSYDTTIHSVQRSLERMNCTYIDVIQLHDPEFAPSLSILIEETIPALLECRKRGWANAIGLTGYPLEVQHQILVECEGKFGVVFDQALVYCHNNLHDMSLFHDACFPPLEKTRGKETDDSEKSPNISYAEFCQQSNIHLMAAAPLSMGLLTTAGPPSWHPASASLKDACSAAAELCDSIGVNISSLAVLYSLCQREVGCTLLGMKDVKQVDLAADLAMRFCDINFDNIIDECSNGARDCKGMANEILDQVLSLAEKDALALILDENQGPFASVISNGEYRWDGKEEAKKFWALVDQLKEKDDYIQKSVVVD